MVRRNKGARRATLAGEGFHQAIVVSIHKGFNLERVLCQIILVWIVANTWLKSPENLNPVVVFLSRPVSG